MSQERNCVAGRVEGQAQVDSQTPDKQPRSLPIAQRGIRTSHDFAQLMSAMMSDVIEGNLTPSVSNAAVNAGGKLLKVIELQHKYGTKTAAGGEKTLTLCHDGAAADGRAVQRARVEALREALREEEANLA